MPPGDSRVISSGSTTTVASYSRPLVDIGSTRPTRAEPSPASRPARRPAGRGVTTATDALDVLQQLLQLGGATAAAAAGPSRARRAARRRSRAPPAGCRRRAPRCGSRRPRSRRSRGRCGSWCPCGTASAAGCRSASSRAWRASAASGHEAWAASPTTVHEDHRPRRPSIRHCIGERSWASSMSTWAYSAGPPAARASNRSRGSAGRPRSRGRCPAVRRALADLGDAVAGDVVELLDLVERALLARRLAGRAEPGGQVVDERDVGHGPGAGLEGGLHRARRAARPRRADSTPRGVAAQAVVVGEPQQHLARVQRGATTRHERLDVRVVAEPRRGTRPLALPVRRAAHAASAEGLQGGVGGVVALVRAQDLAAHPVEPRGLEPDRPAGHERAELGRASGDDVAGGAAPAPAGSAAEPLIAAAAGGSRRAVVTPSTTSPSERSVTRLLAEGGQHPLDVGRVGARRGRRRGCRPASKRRRSE